MDCLMRMWNWKLSIGNWSTSFFLQFFYFLNAIPRKYPEPPQTPNYHSLHCIMLCLLSGFFIAFQHLQSINNLIILLLKNIVKFLKFGKSTKIVQIMFFEIFRELTDITMLSSYIHLRYVDLSRNNLRDLSPLNSLTHLLVLNVNNNHLTSARLDQLPYLQTISFANNKIKSLEGIDHPMLEHLNLNSTFKFVELEKFSVFNFYRLFEKQSYSFELSLLLL